MFDYVLGGWKWYRKMRGGTWRELHCPDGFWYRADERQRTFCYCPDCKNELCSDRDVDCFERDGLVYYQCRCGTESRWMFDAPVPLIIGTVKRRWVTDAMTGQHGFWK